MLITKQQFNKLAKQAMDNYARKIKFEKPFGKEINSFFDGLVTDFNDYYVKHGAAIGLNSYQKDLENILKDHHVDVASSFSNNLRNIIGKPSNDVAMQRKLDANIKGFAAQRSHLMSHEIIDTTRDNMELSIRNAQIASSLAETELSNKEIANLATNTLKEKLINRAPNITTTETQAAAETGKSLEFETMVDTDSEIDGEPVKEMVQKKVWITVLDSFTRDDHAEADAQEVGIDEPFEVGGDQMMTPGDDSLGAGPDQLCNCRCSSEFFIE
jgi:hypothetical protein